MLWVIGNYCILQCVTQLVASSLVVHNNYSSYERKRAVPWKVHTWYNDSNFSTQSLLDHWISMAYNIKFVTLLMLVTHGH